MAVASSLATPGRKIPNEARTSSENLRATRARRVSLRSRGEVRVQLGHIRFDPQSLRLTDARGQDVAIRPQSLKVLAVLARRPGMVVSRDTLFAEVWGDLHVTDDSLTQCIGDIRKALGDDRREILQTVPRRGFRLVANPPRTAPAAGRRWRLPALLGTLVVALAAGLLALRAAPTRPARPEVAVLPVVVVEAFDDIAGDDRLDRLGRGLAAETAGLLARNDWLVVQFGDDVPADATAGRRIFVLAGTLLGDAERLRLSLRLSEAATGRIDWSEEWSGPRGDLLDATAGLLQGIETQLAASYQGAVAAAIRSAAHARPTSSLDAFELYILGTEAKHRFDPEGYAQAVDYLQRAVAIDPGFARAWAALQTVHILEMDYATGEAQIAALRASADEAGQRG
jgi:DNA-binding winged helix-turn-helix (wHTH) protein/TolB-like protein